MEEPATKHFVTVNIRIQGGEVDDIEVGVDLEYTGKINRDKIVGDLALFVEHVFTQNLIGTMVDFTVFK